MILAIDAHAAWSVPESPLVDLAFTLARRYWRSNLDIHCHGLYAGLFLRLSVRPANAAGDEPLQRQVSGCVVANHSAGLQLLLVSFWEHQSQDGTWQQTMDGDARELFLAEWAAPDSWKRLERKLGTILTLYGYTPS